MSGEDKQELVTDADLNKLLASMDLLRISINVATERYDDLYLDSNMPGLTEYMEKLRASVDALIESFYDLYHDSATLGAASLKEAAIKIILNIKK